MGAMENTSEVSVRPRSRFATGMRLLRFVFERFVDGTINNARIIFIERDLFFGGALFCIGLLNFESDKYCDGNTAEYLSCTRPATFYYFDALDITCIMLGIFFIMLWYLKSRVYRGRENLA